MSYKERGAFFQNTRKSFNSGFNELIEKTPGIKRYRFSGSPNKIFQKVTV